MPFQLNWNNGVKAQANVSDRKRSTVAQKLRKGSKMERKTPNSQGMAKRFHKRNNKRVAEGGYSKTQPYCKDKNNGCKNPSKQPEAKHWTWTQNVDITRSNWQVTSLTSTRNWTRITSQFVWLNWGKTQSWFRRRRIAIRKTWRATPPNEIRERVLVKEDQIMTRREFGNAMYNTERQRF